MNVMRRISAVIVALVVAVGLSGCDQFLPEPLAFTLVDEHPVVRTCIPLTITSQSISVYSSDDDREGNVIWSATGEAVLEAGAEFELGGDMPGFTVARHKDEDFLDRQFKFEMEVSSVEGGDWSTFAYFAGGELSEGEWVDSQGYELDVPCTHDDCSRFAACFNNWPEPTGYPTEPDATFSPSGSPTPASR